MADSIDIFLGPESGPEPGPSRVWIFETCLNLELNLAQNVAQYGA